MPRPIMITEEQSKMTHVAMMNISDTVPIEYDGITYN